MESAQQESVPVECLVSLPDTAKQDIVIHLLSATLQPRDHALSPSRVADDLLVVRRGPPLSSGVPILSHPRSGISFRGCDQRASPHTPSTRLKAIPRLQCRVLRKCASFSVDSHLETNFPTSRSEGTTFVAALSSHRPQEAARARRGS